MAWSGFSGHGTEAPHHAVAGGYRPADDEYGVISTDRTKYVRPTFTIQRRGNGLRTAGHCSKHQHLAYPIET
jgi:hypothetical protein